MAKVIPAQNYYIAGGKLFFKKKGATDYKEIGDVVNTKATFSAEYIDVMNHSGKTEVLAKKIAKSFNGTLKFETTDWSEDALAMMLMATTNSATVTDTDAGWSAQSVIKFDIGQNTIIEGAFKFISDNTSGEPIILEVFNASIKPSGDLNLQAKDIGNLSFEGAVMIDKTTKKYATMYVATVDDGNP